MRPRLMANGLRFQELASLESTPLNHSDVQTIDQSLPLPAGQQCFLCLDVLHRYTSDDFIQQVTIYLLVHALTPFVN